jgi:hypothetical protein
MQGALSAQAGVHACAWSWFPLSPSTPFVLRKHTQGGTTNKTHSYRLLRHSRGSGSPCMLASVTPAEAGVHACARSWFPLSPSTPFVLRKHTQGGTTNKIHSCRLLRHSRASGSPCVCPRLVPAFAGTTTESLPFVCSVTPAEAGVHACAWSWFPLSPSTPFVLRKHTQGGTTNKIHPYRLLCHSPPSISVQCEGCFRRKRESIPIFISLLHWDEGRAGAPA